uniref:4-coumarate--CoA ligase n=1 Tax=Picea sitchensis TaxID=3332 RepID=B8LRA6_PICSI|nr:unknown [Picea sitchensis]
MEKSGYGRDGIFRSLRPPLKLPKDENANMVSFMFRDSSSYAHRLALADADSGEKLSFREFKDKVSIVGSGLSQLGLRKGDVVLLFSPNSIYFPVCFFGIVSIGAVATTVNPLYTTMEISKQIQDSKLKLIVTVPELWDKVKDLGLPTIMMGMNGDSKSASSSIISFSDVFTMGVQKSPPEVIIKQTDTAALFYSSGTTGINKAVVLTHKNFMAAALMMTSDQELKGERHLTFLCLLPMFHIYGLGFVTYGQLQRGNAVVSMGKYTFVRMLEVIQEYKITNLPLVPPIAISITKENIVKRYDLSSLKEVITAAAPLGKDIMQECANKIPQAIMTQGYGLTESCGIATIIFPKERNGHFGSAGTLVPGLEAKIVNLETGRPLPPNQRGEVWLRGPNIMTGYFNNPNATKMTLDKEGWLHTGDMGYFDDKGGLFIVDRIKELIKYKGFQVAPAELEGLLLTHPQIVDAGVIPFPDLNAGEVPIAYVVCTPGSSLTEKNFMDYVAKQVAPFKRLHRINFVDSIPRSSSGKILRRELIAKTKSKL